MVGRVESRATNLIATCPPARTLPPDRGGIARAARALPAAQERTFRPCECAIIAPCFTCPKTSTSPFGGAVPIASPRSSSHRRAFATATGPILFGLRRMVKYTVRLSGNGPAAAALVLSLDTAGVVCLPSSRVSAKAVSRLGLHTDLGESRSRPWRRSHLVVAWPRLPALVDHAQHLRQVERIGCRALGGWCRAVRSQSRTLHLLCALTPGLVLRPLKQECCGKPSAAKRRICEARPAHKRAVQSARPILEA